MGFEGWQSIMDAVETRQTDVTFKMYDQSKFGEKKTTAVLEAQEAVQYQINIRTRRGDVDLD
jgi:hypothetical protein